ncbi:MAG: zinc ribbon domain-containing protein [Chloroflexota bacterium]|nr:zinc ribbon domain-containing protein [Chloroflexota bacterium]
MLHTMLSPLRAAARRKPLSTGAAQGPTITGHPALKGAGVRNRRFPYVTRLLMLAFMLAIMGALAFGQAPVAWAGGGGTITWDTGMIYQGQSNPQGPVGENAVVHGTYLPNQKLNLKLVPGDASTAAATVCLAAGTVVGSVTTDATGNFTDNFKWPATANQVNMGYSVCTVSPVDGLPHAGTTPFTVLSASPPSITISTATVAQGATLTVTGQDWVPPQQLTVNIAGCAACEPGNTEVTGGQATSTGLNTGTFSLTLTIPATTKPGKYVVDTISGNGLLDAFYTSGIKHLTITAAALVTTPTVASTPTQVATTPTVSTNGTPNTVPTTTTSTTPPTTSTDNGGNGGLVIALIVAIALIVLAIIALIIYLLMQRSSKSKAPVRSSGPASSPGGGYGQYMQGTPNGLAGDPNIYRGYNTPPAAVPGNYGQGGQYTPQASPPAGMPGNYGQAGQYTPPLVSDPHQTIAYTQGSNPNDATWAMPAAQFPPAAPADGSYGRSPQVRSSAGLPGNQLAGTCRQCGAPLSPDEVFCGRCGARRDGSNGASGINSNTWSG